MGEEEKEPVETDCSRCQRKTLHKIRSVRGRVLLLLLGMILVVYVTNLALNYSVFQIRFDRYQDYIVGREWKHALFLMNHSLNDFTVCSFSFFHVQRAHMNDPCCFQRLSIRVW